MRRAVVCLVALVLVGTPTACAAPSAPPAPAPPAVSAPPEAGALGTTQYPSPAVVPSSGGPAARRSTGWEITVYYTAVERFHDGPAERVIGCPRLECRRGDADLGTYPTSFVRAVHDEGTGRTAGGRYLNWSSDVGYWLDTAPRDTAGRALTPFESAAADPGVLARGTRFAIVDCGRTRIAGPVCAKLSAARWTVTDEFTPGLGGSRHLDVYLGEETGPGFTDSDWYTTLDGATIAISR
ncbi:hypothetical protein Val02_58510 [Virgisporangium aliadipatigenens]|uniref:3D domain-containing protein n=1 Tax=Virgisporangium aliadipatigenens TaxID=741659 RepID=A0A8J3YSA9_9ACTN|nr:hypothetical protein [Virgisporangium aliadipatigenens]GIJ48965.1 hypothetical protein Val02_58510 [Virgisporangium aliadipatigenens]